MVHSYPKEKKTRINFSGKKYFVNDESPYWTVGRWQRAMWFMGRLYMHNSPETFLSYCCYECNRKQARNECLLNPLRTGVCNTLPLAECGLFSFLPPPSSSFTTNGRGEAREASKAARERFWSIAFSEGILMWPWKFFFEKKQLSSSLLGFYDHNTAKTWDIAFKFCAPISGYEQSVKRGAELFLK